MAIMIREKIKTKKIKGYKYPIVPEIGDIVNQKIKKGGIVHSVDGIVYDVSIGTDSFKLKDKYGNKNDRWFRTRDFEKSTVITRQINENSTYKLKTMIRNEIAKLLIK